MSDKYVGYEDAIKSSHAYKSAIEVETKKITTLKNKEDDKFSYDIPKDFPKNVKFDDVLKQLNFVIRLLFILILCPRFIILLFYFSISLQVSFPKSEFSSPWCGNGGGGPLN